MSFFKAMQDLGMKRVKLWVYVPEENANEVRLAAGKAGAGKIGDYSFCAFVKNGTGHFLGGEDSNPAVGEKGKLETVDECRIEMECNLEVLKNVREAILEAHPYEEVPIDILPLFDWSDVLSIV